jgi:hypothetical protein
MQFDLDQTLAEVLQRVVKGRIDELLMEIANAHARGNSGTTCSC